MTVGIIGRSEYTYNTMVALEQGGHRIAFVVTAKEAPEYLYTSADFQQFAQQRGIPFLHDPKVSADKLQALMADTRADICISVNYSGIISQEVIDLFPLGILNAHGGDLPRYRGNACQAWAIINGEERIGLCIHKMKGGELDNGDIISRAYLGLGPDTRLAQVYAWMDTEIPRLMADAVDRLAQDGSYVLEVQSADPKDALRCYPRQPSDGRIEWHMPAVDVVRLVNASSEPYPGAFAYLGERKVTVWRANLVTDYEQWCGVAGQVAHIDTATGAVILLCGEGKVRISEIEVDGVRDVPTRWITSLRNRLG